MVIMMKKSRGIFFLIFISLYPISQQERLLDDKIAQNPHDYTSWYSNGVCAYKRKDFVKAAHCFEQTIKEGNKRFNLSQEMAAHYNLGNTYAETKQYDQAITEYEKVLTLDPDHRKAQEKKKLVEILKKRQQEEQQKPDDNNKSAEDSTKNESEDTQEQDKEKNEQTKGNAENQEQNKIQNTSEQNSKQREESTQEQGQNTQGQQGIQNKKEDGDHNEKLPLTQEENEYIQNIIDKAMKQQNTEKPSDENEKKLVAVLDEIDNQAQKQMLCAHRKSGQNPYENLW
jgi:Ca-activated chloride channel homolog